LNLLNTQIKPSTRDSVWGGIMSSYKMCKLITFRLYFYQQMQNNIIEYNLEKNLKITHIQIKPSTWVSVWGGIKSSQNVYVCSLDKFINKYYLKFPKKYLKSYNYSDQTFNIRFSLGRYNVIIQNVYINNLLALFYLEK
jgi:hypothetical protein